MTVTIQLSDELANSLQAEAAAEGVPIELWLQRLAARYADEHRHPHTMDVPTEERTLWETIAERVDRLPAEIFERLPRDGASEHDHYLYGSAKRNQ